MRPRRLTLPQPWITHSCFAVFAVCARFLLSLYIRFTIILGARTRKNYRSVYKRLSLYCVGNIVCAASIPLHCAFRYCSPRPNKPSVRLRLSMPCFTDNAASHTKTLNRRQHTVTAQCINRPSVIWIKIWYQKKLIATLSIPHSQHYKCPCQGQETETLPHPRFPQKFSQFKQ